MIYLSTGMYKKDFTSKIINNLIKNNITNIELSSGLYEKNITKKIICNKKRVNYLIHNYFPPPKKAFVFNLSSNNHNIRNKSINLAIKAIQLSKKVNAHYYSFHGGFLIDPDIKTLGMALETQVLISKKDGIQNFVNSVQILSYEAKKQGIELLIENNVLTKENLLKYKKNPLLFLEADEIIAIIKKLPSNVGILLDVGHLNVSAKTLKFCKYEFIKKCNNWIKGYHLSENNGVSDQNKPIKDNSWFWKVLKKNSTYSLEIKFRNIPFLKEQLKLANKKINNLC